MDISDLIKQRLTIESWDVTPEIEALNEKLSLLKNDIAGITIDDFEGNLADVDNDIANTIHDMHDLVTHINNLKLSAYELMQTMSKEPMGISYDMYDKRKHWVNEEFLNQCRELDQFKDNEVYVHRFNTLITKFAAWQFPTAYVRPNSMHFWDALKASDSIYVVDQAPTNKFLFQNLKRNFFDTLRFKQIDENKDEFLTNILPKGNIGLIVMEHFMHFKPMDVMKQYLAESFELLRPGGHLLFTYNNCDLPAGAKNFEKSLYCFQPGRMVKMVCELAGFEVVNEEATDRVSWFALKKPGELTSIKGGKTLGQIMEEIPNRST